MQEDIEHRSVALATNTTKMTARVLARLMRSAVRQMNKSRTHPKVHKEKIGRQSMAELSKDGPLSSVEISKDNIKAFDPIARKYCIAYELKEDKSTNPPRWLVFFKAKSADSMTAAFTEFSNKVLNSEKDRPSTREKIRNLQESVKNVFRDKTRHKHREVPER